MGMTETATTAIGSVPHPFLVERRRFPRYPFTASVEAVELTSQTRIQGRTTDLSRGGCYVDTINPLPEQTTVRIRLTRENRSVEAQAKVVYSVVGMGMGVMFVSADREQLLALERWIGQLSGELPSEANVPEPPDQTCAATNSNDAQADVLSELVIELMRQGVLSGEKGKEMLGKLHR